MIKNPAVPDIRYHSIGIPSEKWQWSYLTCPYEMFEDHLRWMKKKGFHTISLQHLYDYRKEDVALPKNSIVLTFDDGYLDNWTFAYPLLKKYGFKGTIYINPDFADPRNIIRKNLEDVCRGKAKIAELENMGYLSWKEMKEMETAVKPTEVILVIDGTIGQQAAIQAKAFHEATPIGSILVAKLDGSARGGGALSAVAAIGAPIKFIGTGI